MPLIEEILAEFPLVCPCDRDRRDVVQASNAQRPSEFDRVVGAADVDGGIELQGRGHVIDGGQMEEMIDRPCKL